MIGNSLSNEIVEFDILKALLNYKYLTGMYYFVLIYKA